MPSPKNQELGIKSPKRLRGGIDFPTWEGLNFENDPGAIRDTQFTEMVNVRIDGNEVFSRGGQEKIHTQAMTGCVYGMIDVPEGATSLMLVSNPQTLPPTIGQLDRYYSEASPTYNNVFEPFLGTVPEILLQGIPDDASGIASSANPRRSLARFGGNLFQFGFTDNGVAFPPTLFKVVLPERTSTVSGASDVGAQAKREAVVDLPEFASWAVRKENVDGSTAPSATIKEILYIGSVTTGAIYRWDGSALTTETTGLPASRHIVVNYADDIWAMAGNKLRKRDGGVWTTEFTFATTETPHAATDYLSNLIIVRGNDFVVFNGSTFTVTTPTSGGETSTLVTDVKPFGGDVYYTWRGDGASPSAFLGKWNGSTFTHAVISAPSESSMCGSLEVAGPYLYWTFSTGTGGVTTAFLRRVDINDSSQVLNSRTTWPTSLDAVIGPAMDMVAF